MSGLREKVLSYVSGKKGQQDGNGECWTLAENALKSAGAKTSWELTPNKKNFGSADYVWGKKIAKADVAAGDILQFKDYSWRVDGSDGSWQTMGYGHHTSVAIGQLNGLGTVRVLHQNVPDDNPNKKLVVENGVPLRDATWTSEGVTYTLKVKGTVSVYTPIK
ncbi:MAG: hypothetical protein AAF318_15450 [Pseudomonadota bacterium]